MFPNLEDLNICCRKMCVTDFTSLCNNLPHLRTLNISSTGIKNLNGPAKLQNLECLSIYGLLFETREDIKDLFELKKLKKLIFGYCSCVYLDHNHLNIYKRKVLNMLSMNLKHHLKKRTHPSDNVFNSQFVGIELLIKVTENFNADKICSLAMKSIIHGGGLRDFEQSCAVIIDILMDRMDLSSEYYKTINFRKLHACLRIIQNKTNLLPERRASAGNVLRFVELFM
ncbi:hypothetical protein CAEBREN_06170 [Caenorhabditis brenneri]|uniref:Uncharacterized protein n=1 Tax=Caenorhabditis brenneri TaxID=135651 RepID=G0PCV8_CAEBE|nr:hypothetical protein CAEBREN_06170 [Caenorhabditis brenneri]